MLGRQFNLVVTEHDLDLIEGVLRSRGDVQFLSSSTNEGRNALLPLKSLRVDESPPGPWQRLCYLVPSDRLARVDIQPLSDVKVHVDVITSELIEFNRSYCAKGAIQGDRIFYAPRYFDDEGIHDKDPEFVKWAERTVRAIKKILRYDKELMAQIGPDAARKLASGELKIVR